LKDLTLYDELNVVNVLGMFVEP